MKQNRILVTESQADYPKQLIQVLCTHSDVILYVIAKNADELSTLMSVHSQQLNIIPVLLDVNRNERDTRAVLKQLPKLDCIINFTGPLLWEKIVLNKKPFKHEEITIHPHLKVEKVLNKVQSKSISHENGVDENTKHHTLFINATYSDGSNMEHATLSQQQSANAAAITKSLTSSLRSSFRRLFKKSDSLPPPPPSTPTSPATRAGSPSSIRTDSPSGSGRFFATPSPSSASSSSSPTPKATTGTGILALNSSDFKLSKKLHKLFKDSEKKFKSKNKQFKSWEKKQGKLLNQNMAKFRQQEEAIVRQSNADANSATLAKSNALSNETAAEIVQRRNAWGQKKVERKTQLKFKTETSALEETIEKQRKLLVEAHYEKVFAKQLQVLEKYGN